jgi:recombinase
VRLDAPSGYDPGRRAGEAHGARSGVPRADAPGPDATRLAEQGLSPRAIVSELNRFGVPTSKGRTWQPTSVRRVLPSA